MLEPHSRAAPETVFLHGRLWTMDAHRPHAEAMAVVAGRILAVGSDSEIAALAAPSTRQVDLRRRLVLPGFHDAHTHQLLAGLAQFELDLTGARSLGEFQRRIAAYAAGLPPGTWIVGSGWDHTLWAGQGLPTRHDLDAVTGDHPALLRRQDVHASVANSRALALAGVTRATAAPPGAKIGREPGGEPSGMLYEEAQALVRRCLPPLSPARRRRALAFAMQDALRHGITSVQDNSGWDTFLAYERMRAEGELRLRVTEWLAFDDPLAVLLEQRAHHDPADTFLRTGLLKAFLDGSLGSRTAALLAPYSDDPTTSGNPQYESDDLNRLAAERARAGFQVGFHAIGDRAARMALDAFDAARTAAPRLRHRLEHAQVIAPAEIRRMAALGAIASVQPSHLLSDCRWALARLGPERAQSSYPWQTFLRHGVTLAFGTDCPVEPVNPMRALYAAVTRASLDGEIAYPPADEIVSLEQAVYASTMGAAIAAGEDTGKGSLTSGKLADFVILSHDLRQIPPSDFLQAQVKCTVIGGEVMYAAPDWDG